MKKFDAVFFTDMTAKIYHVKPLGPYRLASELRSAGYSVLVVDYFSNWLEDFKSLSKLLRMSISDQTKFVGYSGTFFTYKKTSNANVIPKINSHKEYYGIDYGRENDVWPCDQEKIHRMNRAIKGLNPRTKIFYGGSQVPQIGKNFKDSGVDYLVNGFADGIIVDIMKRLEDGRFIKYNLFNGMKLIDYDIRGESFDFKNSETIYEDTDAVSNEFVLPLETSRGCLFKCSFCEFPLIGRKKGDPDYHKNADRLKNELVRNYEMYGIKKYMIVDDTFNETTGKLEVIYDILQKNNISIEFLCYLRADLLERFPEQIPLLKNMGLRSSFLGIETLNPQAAKSVGKKSHPDNIKNTLSMAKDVWKDDVLIYASFIAGLPHDNEETINNWIQWVYDSPDLIDSFILTPLKLVSRFHLSDLQSRPDYYGFKIDGDKWTNNLGFTSAQAEEISDYWMEKSWAAGRLKIGAKEILGLQNLGYEFNEIMQYRINNLPYEEIGIRYQEKFKRYQDILFNLIKNDAAPKSICTSEEVK